MRLAPSPKTFASGAALVWRWQRILWWIFIISLVLAYWATKGMAERADWPLSHSVASGRLVNGFDLFSLAEFAGQPDTPLEQPGPAVFHYSVIFAIFMLFATGGIVTTYVFDAKPTTTAFFEACGHHFWRFFRLVIYLLLAIIPVAIFTVICRVMRNRIDAISNSPRSADFFFIGALLIILLLIMVLRLWFDMAQVIAVVEDETRMHRALRHAGSLFAHNFGSLFWLYLRISLLAWIAVGLGVYIWMFRLSPLSTTAAFLLTQLMLVFWIAARLWQRACEALWYRQYQAASVTEPACNPAPSPEPAPLPYSTAAN